MSESPADPVCGGSPVSFAAFVLSLSTTALQHMGVDVSGSGSPPPVQLPLARQTIDILEMLEQKTRGNLSAEESKLLTAILYDLRMRFVSACQGKCS